MKLLARYSPFSEAILLNGVFSPSSRHIDYPPAAFCQQFGVAVMLAFGVLHRMQEWAAGAPLQPVGHMRPAACLEAWFLLQAPAQ